jgi:hypothetical protein
VWFKHRAWIPVAWLLSAANVAAVWFAARPAEPWHATGHALLATLFGLGALRLTLRKEPPIATEIVTRQEMEARLATIESHQLVQALDAIAVEVERIGESQRYLTKLLAERDARPPEAIRSPTQPEQPR